MHNKPSTDTEMIGGFDEMILPHLDAAHNLARWLVRGSDDVEDVVQEACLRALRYFGTFRGGNARAWLLRIVRTTAFSRLQKNRTYLLAAEFDEEIHSDGGEALNPETVLLQRADRQLVEQAMNHLPDGLREVLMLRELEGLSYKEIAEVVGVPLGTVMSTLFRARERFRHAATDLLRRQARAAGSSDVGAGDQEPTAHGRRAGRNAVTPRRTSSLLRRSAVQGWSGPTAAAAVDPVPVEGVRGLYGWRKP